MGLSIYYRLKVKSDADRARELVRALHAFVATLPFDEVSPIKEYDPPDGRYAFDRADDGDGERHWNPGDIYINRRRDDGGTELVPVPAKHVVCFHANLEGSETASFGLASHPPVVVHREEVMTRDEDGIETHHIGAGKPVEVPTRLRGWYSWSQACKTQYAGNPKFGGPSNFLRAHLSVFRAVDHAKTLGLTTFIRDDARYCRHRNEAKLLDVLSEYDRMIAGFAGRLSDALGDAGQSIVAPIKDRPDFEHLEADATRLTKKTKRQRKPKGS